MISLEREKLLSELEQKIGYGFRSRSLLDRALTHRSYANERLEEKCRHNEALEFLGDSVLGLVVSSWLLAEFPDLSEGKLSKMKAYLVSESSLVDLAENLDLGRYLLLNRGEEKTGGRRKRALLADAYEALIGVLYLDGGLENAGRFLRREMRDKVAQIDPSAMIGSDYKSALQEQLQAAGAPVPEYVLVAALGPDHRRTFRVELRVGGQTLALGEGRTIKLAQQEAARSSLTEPELINSVLAAHIQMLDDEIEIVEDETADVEYLAEMASDDESNDEEETPCCQRATLAFDGQKSALSDETEEELMLTNAPTDFQTEKKIG